MKKLFAAALLAISATMASAEITGNLGLVSDYRFRGVSQTQNAPAVQGGVDYSHASGFYAGNWNSSVSSQLYSTGAGVENDVYFGFRRRVANNVTIDVGSMNYYYPRAVNGTTTDFNTNEVYVGAGLGDVVTARYSQSLGNYFGTANSKDSSYVQIDAAVPVASKVSLVGHIGRADVKNSAALNYTDYNVGVSYDLSGWAVSARYYDNISQGSGFQAANTVSGQQLYRNTTVVAVSRSFK